MTSSPRQIGNISSLLLDHRIPGFLNLALKKTGKRAGFTKEESWGKRKSIHLLQ
jgi:hypothetical protein